MGARQKLNSIYVYACLSVSAAVGFVGRSWLLFLITLAVTVATGAYVGAIRHRPVIAHRPRPSSP